MVCCQRCRTAVRSCIWLPSPRSTVYHGTIPCACRRPWPRWSGDVGRDSAGRSGSGTVGEPGRYEGKGTPQNGAWQGGGPEPRGNVGVDDVAMTAMVKDELSRVECTKTSERKAEVTALLRFSGGLHIVGGRVVIEAELDTGSVARRLRRDISEVYGYTSGVSVLAGGNIRRGVRYLVRIAKHGEGLARQTGLVDQRGRPVRGLPPAVVSGSIGDAEAAWRGAFLAHGSLTEPGRSSSLEVTCPGPEAAMALVGAARRLGIAAKAREVRGADRGVGRDGAAHGALLPRMGAHAAVLAWEERRMRREVRATANRLANFDDANLRRSARAAVAASARVERALEILEGDAPEHLLMAGRLRLEHGQASLEELGQRADPPLTNASIAGRHRRPHPPAAGDGRQAAQGPRHPRHRVRRDGPHAGHVALRAAR